MFTTLPLELFVCREARDHRFPPILSVLTCLSQVVEQFFFSHEVFSQQRHLFFTTTILFSSMFGERDTSTTDSSGLLGLMYPFSGVDNL